MNNDDTNNKEELTTPELSAVLQILALERQNNISTKKFTQQEIITKIINIIRKEAENEIQEDSSK